MVSLTVGQAYEKMQRLAIMLCIMSFDIIVRLHCGWEGGVLSNNIASIWEISIKISNSN